MSQEFRCEICGTDHRQAPLVAAQAPESATQQGPMASEAIPPPANAANGVLGGLLIEVRRGVGYTYTVLVNGEEAHWLNKAAGSRRIFATREVIVKVEPSPSSLSQCFKEHRRLTDPKAREYAKSHGVRLPEVLGVGEGWIAVERLEIKEAETDIPANVAAVVDFIGLNDVYGNRNWGVLPDGTPILYDLGV